MRFLVAGALLVAACSAPASASPAPSATSTASAAPATATPSPTAPPVPTLPAQTPVVLPSNAQISAASGDIVWVLVGGSRLFRSTDRGTTWTERGFPVGAQSGEISFTSDREGLILLPGSPATQCQSQGLSMWATHDGAATWESLSPRGTLDRRCKSGISLDSQRAYMSTWDLNTPPAVYASTDGARTWNVSQPFPDPIGLTSGAGGFSLRPGLVRAFGTTLLIDASGLKPSGEVQYAYRSTDAGATWSNASTAPQSSLAITFVTATRWIQIVIPSQSSETTDGGATWHAFTTDYQQAAPVAPQVIFGDPSVGYATVRGAIQRTVDGGAHWTTLKTPGT